MYLILTILVLVLFWSVLVSFNYFGSFWVVLGYPGHFWSFSIKFHFFRKFMYIYPIQLYGSYWSCFNPFFVRFSPFLVSFSYFGLFLSHLGSFLGHFRSFWVFWGHFGGFCPFTLKLLILIYFVIKIRLVVVTRLGVTLSYSVSFWVVLGYFWSILHWILFF